ncbi:Endonuclease/exonuclease/phosphatase [Xylaria bambusicola]|uniref:Endonuclease/exonuclease/phosphatase n=1 Tax=Xylaria bambusicola TaxID=326684 RepID=UPI002008AD3E|nr:Endonuclease/exonuclease/phosphatase [Xylaria bambusicola]KAI0515417.1 Endonuclease/exonuclease/phosphatase [Xylaria bambusicola]
MEPGLQDGARDGPDASSLKPVSSLRSHFENMNKPKEETSSTPTTATTPVLARQRTPSPKPPPVPDTRPTRPKSIISLEAAKSKPQPLNPHEHAATATTTATSALRPTQLAHPPVSPRPIKPPAVLIDPPHSPPINKTMSQPAGDVAALLSPDTTKAPPTPVTPSRSFKIPSRPNTPGLEASRASPRGTSPKPPSPPPPRRSVELRREREARVPPTVPPPINRADKPKPFIVGDSAPKLDPNPAPLRPDQRSPFNTPPSTASVPEDDESPPMLPTRPARPTPQISNIARTTTVPSAFEPPPVHPAVANKRREIDTNIPAKLSSASDAVEDRPALPSRPQTVAEPVPKIPANSVMKPPPRPLRGSIAGVPTANSISVDTTMPAQQPKRISSTPTSQFAPPPTRTHARSMTVDQTSDRAPANLREPPKRFPAAGVSPISSEPPSTSTTQTTGYPDTSRINRRPPFAKHGVHEIYTKYDTRKFDVCGEYVCTSGQLTRVWNLHDGELTASFPHGEGIKSTCVTFKPGLNVNQEGLRVWIGNNIGEVMEADITTQSIAGSKTNIHARHEVIKIFRHYNEMWTLDEGGTLHVWGPDADGIPSLSTGPHQTYRLAKGHTFSIIVGEELWYATGKEIRIFAPTVDGKSQVQVLMWPLVAEGAGEITSGAVTNSQPGKVYFGHSDGKVSIYSQKDFTCLSVLSISTYKINALAGVGNYIWAAYNTGKISIYDVSSAPWVVKKDWQAHNDSPALRLVADRAGYYRLGRQQILSLGADNVIRTWDGLLEDDFLENEMKSMDTQYCTFEDIRVHVMTWNAGASTPSSLRYKESDAAFIQNLLQSSDSPDILVFGFQELVDLEDKTATAKRFLNLKKKDTTDQERMSHQYRDWRDFLVRSLDDYMPADHLYHLLHTATLVGLFTCIFVKSTLRDRVRNLSSVDVKRGMGGLHGNKGAIVVRFMVDDTSLCFINCHLAAGQSQANSRHNDIAAILDSSILPIESNPTVRIDSYIGGGDGSMILDHELCLLNGDLNYRIDTMSRDTVVNAVQANNLAKLLERDQLLVARRRNPAFRLRAFDEMPIQFAPTYKYDVGTDNYDTSEKKRSPAWCDRLLHRGSGRIQQLDYRRHEVRVSDHRPVTGRFKFTIKTISPKKRTLAWADCQQLFEDHKMKEANEEKLSYLMNVIGYDLTTSQGLIQNQSKRSNGNTSHNGR